MVISAHSKNNSEEKIYIKMKNRLQIRHNKSNPLPTRERALQYLEQVFDYRNEAGNTTLIAEPLVILYSDTNDEDNANVILAIGRGGDGEKQFRNKPYFIIDFAKHTEDIAGLSDEIDTNKNNIIEALRRITNNETSIFNIVQTIGDIDNNPDKKTIFGYINSSNAKITTLDNDIKSLSNQLESEYRRAIGVEELLQSSIDNEKTERVANQIKLEDNLQEQSDLLSTKVQNTASELMGKIQTTANELINKINEENDKVDKKLNELQSSVNNKDIELQKNIDIKSNELDSKINKEIFDRINEINTLRIEKNENINTLTNENNRINNELEKEIIARDNDVKQLRDLINVNTTNINKNKVSSSSQTIKINEQETTTDINVNIDNETLIANNGILSVKVNDNDKIISSTSNGLLSTLSLKWVTNTDGNNVDEIQLIGKNNTVISKIDVSPFIKDGILENVSLDQSNPSDPKLIFVFNSASEKQTITLSVKDLIKIYLAGNGLQLNENTFSIKIDNASEPYLTVGNDGIKLSGINNYINNEVGKVNTNVQERVAELSGQINTNKINIEGIKSEYKSEDNKLSDRIDKANALIETRFEQLTSNYQNADNALENKLTTALSSEINSVKTVLENADALLLEKFNTFTESTNVNIEQVKTNFNTAISEVRLDYTNADNQIRTEIAEANQILREQIENKINKNKEDINKDLSELKNSDATIKETLNTQFKELNQVVETKNAEAKKYTDDKVDVEYQRAIQSEDSLKAQIAENASDITAVETRLETEINRAENRENELSTRIETVNSNTVNNINYINSSISQLSNKLDEKFADVSNKVNTFEKELSGITENTKNISNLTHEVDTLRQDLNNEHSDIKNNTEAINTLTNSVATLTNTIEILRAKIETLEKELNNLKGNAITEIQGKANEIDVIKEGNTATIKFADDAYFVAGV